MCFRERATEHREVLAEHEDEPPVDRAVAGDDAVTQVALLLEAEVRGAVRHELIDLDERSRVQQQVHALARGQLAAPVLLVDAFLTASEHRLLAQRPEVLDLLAIGRHAVALLSIPTPHPGRIVPGRPAVTAPAAGATR